jgi:hypothetical protein
MDFRDALEQHCASHWGPCRGLEVWKPGPMHAEFPDFRVLLFQHSGCWIYQTCGMSRSSTGNPVELNLRSWKRHADNVFILTIVAHYHLTGESLDAGHSVNFGKVWIGGGECTHGLVSLPYLDGPTYEKPLMVELSGMRCLWLVPITRAELDFKKENGMEALECEFERHRDRFLYMDNRRKSVVG